MLSRLQITSVRKYLILKNISEQTPFELPWGTLNVIVGPRGRRISRMFIAASFLVNTMKCETLSGPATLTKSLRTFFLRICQQSHDTF